jgi:hypothetical protein
MVIRLPWICAAALAAHAAVAAAADEGTNLTIQNESLAVRFDAGSGRFSLMAEPSHLVFIEDGRVSSDAGSSRVTPAEDKTFGKGQEIVISHADGNSEEILVFPNLPFVLFRFAVHNGSGEAVVKRSVKAWSGRVTLSHPIEELRTFGTAGLRPVDKNPGSYQWLAVVEPRDRNGVVAGWVTDDRGSGVVFSKPEDGMPRLDAQIDFGRLRVGAGKTAGLETFAAGYFDDARLGLERWADTVAAIYQVKLPPQPAGYCTWYSRPFGQASDEKHLAELAAFAATNLAPFGFSLVQIDDHWQAGVSTNGPHRNFTMPAPKGPYPSGMTAAADGVKTLGLRPGIWFMPFAGTYYDPYFKDHQDWFVKRDDGTPYETKWGGTCLDMTEAGARRHVRSEVGRIAHDWGFEYFKIDGLWTGTATRLMYPNEGYADDGMGDAVLHNPDKTQIEAFRDGLKLVREAAGKDVFITGCNAPQNMRSYGAAFGLLDAMRVGPDNGADWDRLLRGPTFGSRHYFLNGRVWYNDPDPVYVRDSMPVDHARLICTWVAISGQLNLSSEWLPGLPADRLDILKRSMPAHGLRPRPVDLFDEPIPRIWLLTDDRRSPRRDVIGLFNWSPTEQTVDESFERIGLTPGGDYIGFDYWENKLAGPFNGRLKMTLPAESCCSLTVRPVADRPQLLGTSRHITQGIIDVEAESWDGAARVLSGRSRVVGGDPYELRIVAMAPDKEWTAKTIKVSAADGAANVGATLTQEGNLVRGRIESPASREVEWSVAFEAADRPRTATGQ